ncbi:MAG TPA: heme-degrading domain-containing protein [Anaerolineales bacterium]|nr:heme-degrading domain-containing protein [Anaerolineales bacterium]
MAELLDQLLQQESELQFASFNENTAWEIGCRLVERAQQDGLPVVIDIMRGTHQLFHAALPGSAPDNDEWAKRKSRAVIRFGHSSFYMGELLKSRNQTIDKNYLIPESEFAPHGGSFPVIVKGTGVVGTITVSGLPSEEDHKLVTDGIRNYLASQK